jgi:hypothetical protein
MTEHAARPLAIDALRAEFVQAAEREAGARRGSLRPLVLAFVALALVAATAFAAGVLPLGKPLPGPPRGDIPPRLLPRAGTTRLDPLRIPDTAGGLPWGVRVSTSRSGATCYAFGRVQQRRLGLVDMQGRFRPLPLTGVGSCGDLSVDPVAFDIRRVTTADGRTRTLVGGVAGRDVQRLVAEQPAPARKLTPSATGAFLLVYDGSVPLSSLQMRAYFRDGQSRRLISGPGQAIRKAG